MCQFNFLLRQPWCSMLGKLEVKEVVTYKVKVMWRHGETLQFAFSDKDNMSEIEREDIVVKIPQPVSSCGAAHTTMKYCCVNFLRKELYIQKNGVLLWKLI